MKTTPTAKPTATIPVSNQAKNHMPKHKEDKYPEHEKMAKVIDQSQVIGAFLDAMSEKGIELCEYSEGDGGMMFPVRKSIEQILADYFEINLKKIEAEKRAMLESIRQDRKS